MHGFTHGDHNYVMHVHSPNNIGKAVQMDSTLCYALGITDEKKCWEFLTQKFDQFQQQYATTCNKVYKRTQHVTPNNVLPVDRGP